TLSGTSALYSVITTSASYPSDPAGIGMRSTVSDLLHTILYEAGTLIAFIPKDVITEVRLLSFDATRYDRGVLLQWRTGYELDNLGFHLYREVNGVRTKITSSPVAGSG